MMHPTNRRDWIKQASGAAMGAAVGVSALTQMAGTAEAVTVSPPLPRARIKQSVSRWCYSRFSLAELCQRAAHIGLLGVDLLQQDDWDFVKDAGLTCTMGYAAERRDFLTNGFTNRASHAMLIKELEAALPIAKAKGVPNLIAMFGNRAGRSDAEAIAAAVDGLKQVAPIAEATGINVCVELLNSKVDHKDYIGHYHTAGVPGRHELDNEQEVNWPAVMQAIVATGFTGYVAHEFIPKRDPWLSLADAYSICNVG